MNGNLFSKRLHNNHPVYNHQTDFVNIKRPDAVAADTDVQSVSMRPMIRVDLVDGKLG